MCPPTMILLAKQSDADAPPGLTVPAMDSATGATLVHGLRTHTFRFTEATSFEDRRRHFESLIHSIWNGSYGSTVCFEADALAGPARRGNRAARCVPENLRQHDRRNALRHTVRSRRRAFAPQWPGRGEPAAHRCNACSHPFIHGRTCPASLPFSFPRNAMWTASSASRQTPSGRLQSCSRRPLPTVLANSTTNDMKESALPAVDTHRQPRPHCCHAPARQRSAG